MSPEQMSDRLHEWRRDSERATGSIWSRRVVCVEPDGPRRTWVLYDGSRQVGHVRMRATPTPYTVSRVPAWGPPHTEMLSVDEWTVEASDRTRAMLGLDA